jgi:hypothetical protein
VANIDLSDYIPVYERLKTFKEAHPEGRMVSEVIETSHPGFIAVKAYAYRTPDDPQPGTGLAWEPVPGPTPFTKNSELQNAETAAWGRALVAALIADASHGIASREEVEHRQERASRSPWSELFDKTKVLKDWSDKDRADALQTAVDALAITSGADMTHEEADRIWSHVQGQYESRSEQAALDV